MSTNPPACRSVSMHCALISPGLLVASFSRKPSRAVLCPSEVSKSATTALISELDPGSIFACLSALPLAKLSLSSPQRPLGSATVTAIPAIITLSRRTFHSSGVKFDLSAIAITPPIYKPRAVSRSWKHDDLGGKVSNHRDVRKLGAALLPHRQAAAPSPNLAPRMAKIRSSPYGVDVVLGLRVGICRVTRT